MSFASERRRRRRRRHIWVAQALKHIRAPIGPLIGVKRRSIGADRVTGSALITFKYHAIRIRSPWLDLTSFAMFCQIA